MGDNYNSHLGEHTVASQLAFGGILPYSDGYKDKCFLTWYAQGRPKIMVLRGLIEGDEHGRVPTSDVLKKWRMEQDWEQRANDMDLAVQRKVAEATIAEKVEMLQRHAKQAFGIIQTGLDYLKEKGPETSSVALRMVVEGIRIERDSVGLADAIAKVAQMNDSELNKTISQLMSKIAPGELDDFIDHLGEDEVVEGQATEVSDGSGE